MYLLGSFALDLIAAIATLSIAFYFWWISAYDFWKKKNVPYAQDSFLFGSLGDSLSGKVSFMDKFVALYREFRSVGYGGIFMFRKPALLVCSPEMIKQIVTKDFSSFHDRGAPYDEERDPISANLFNLSGHRWKTLRAKLSPTFTSGKIKGMFPLIYDCTNNFKDCIEEKIRTSSSIELKDMLYRFGSDVIGTCAFGVDCNSLKDPTSETHTLSQEVVRMGYKNMLRFVLTTAFPKLVGYLTHARLFPKPVSFFTGLMDSTVKYRKDNNVERNDFVQLTMKIVEEDENTFSMGVMTAQAFFFFFAGLDNVANTVGFCLHELAVNQEMQESVYQEIRNVLDEYEEKNCYEAIQKMDLVKRVVDEALRKYPSIGFIMRVLTKDKYKIPGTDVEISKGMGVMVPVTGLHYDENLFPNPDKFDPDRFTEEEKSKRHPFAYLPFGEGPRVCIAERFVLLEMRLCLVELVRHFKFEVAPETDLAMEYDVTSFGPSPKHGFWFKVSERANWDA